MHDDDFKNEPFPFPDPETLQKHNQLCQELLDNLPSDHVDLFRYSALVSELAEILKNNPRFQNKMVVDFLLCFEKVCHGQWKRLKYICELLRESEKRHVEDIALNFMSVTAKLLEITETRQTSKAHLARRKIGLKNRIDMREYYEPILKAKDTRFNRIHLFQKQFDLFWEHHHQEILKRSAARRGKRNKTPSVTPEGNASGKRPYKLYPACFNTFRVGFYRWRKRYDEDSKAYQAQQELDSFLAHFLVQL